MPNRAGGAIVWRPTAGPRAGKPPGGKRPICCHSVAAYSRRMRLSFWSAKRLLPVYGLLLIGLPIVWGLIWLLWHFRAPEWTVSAILIVWAVTWISAGIRAAILQARDNAASPPDWLTGKPRTTNDR